MDEFIENVYRNLDITPPCDSSARNSVQFQTRRSPNASISPTDSPAGAASLSFSTPERRINIDAEVERSKKLCFSFRFFFVVENGIGLRRWRNGNNLF